MKRTHYISWILTVLFLGLTGCSNGRYDLYPPEDPTGGQKGTPRLVVSGTVTNAEAEPLQGIYVAIFGVREPGEPDVLSYNYALTDSAGKYAIVRYRGREIPTEVTVVATDSTGLYEEQLLFATVTYDSIKTSSGKQPYNAFVTADFVLSLQP